MDWSRHPGDDPADPHGVADLLGRACLEVSSQAVAGTRFLFSTSQMLQVSREIEQTSIVQPDNPLFVGVQRGHRLDDQAEVYQSLLDSGVTVYAFGTDEGPSLTGIQWTQVPAIPHSLGASWFLVRGGNGPHALVGFELNPGEDSRRWEGFETSDPALVLGILDHLLDLSGPGVAREVKVT